MSGNLDKMGFNIIPEDVSGGMWNITKEDAFSGVWNKFGNLCARRFYPSPAAKSSQFGEVFRLAMWVGELDWRFVFSSFWECV